MDNIAIVGVGLIGGSFGLALRAAGFKGRIAGVSSPTTIAKAIDRGAIDEGAPLAEAVAKADVVLLSTPILDILEKLPEVDAHIRPGALITDAGSTKSRIVERAKGSVHRGRFLGGHPMAGKEMSGVANAEPGLFKDRPWAFCAAAEALGERESDFVAWVSAVGGRPVFFTPEEHDRAVAFSSHLPQLVSIALTSAVGDAARAAEVAGPGLIDMTRLAASPYELWRDIIVTNDGPILEAVEKFIEEMEKVQEQLSRHDLSEMFRASKTVSAGLRWRGSV